MRDVRLLNLDKHVGINMYVGDRVHKYLVEVLTIHRSDISISCPSLACWETPEQAVTLKSCVYKARSDSPLHRPMLRWCTRPGHQTLGGGRIGAPSPYAAAPLLHLTNQSPERGWGI